MGIHMGYFSMREKGLKNPSGEGFLIFCKKTFSLAEELEERDS